MGQKILSVFTEKYKKVENKILNKVILSNGDIYDQAIAQWDTGATGTCISEETIKKYQLEPVGKTNIKTPSGSCILNTYIIDLILNNEIIFPNLKVIGSKIGAQGIDILIGMDVISSGDFAISNFDAKTQFSFRIPSQDHVDYKTKK